MGKQKKGRNILIAGGLIVALVLLILFVNGSFEDGFPLAVSGGDNYVQSPVFMYYECNSVAPASDSEIRNIPKDGGEYQCPENSAGCDVYVLGEDNAWLDRRFVYTICQKDGGFCFDEETMIIDSSWSPFGGTNRPQRKLTTLTIDQKVNIKFERLNIIYWADRAGSQIYYQYEPFGIWKVALFGGGKNVYNSNDCILDRNDRNKAITHSTIDFDKNPNPTGNPNSARLDFFKTMNFIETFVPLSVENVQFVDWNGDLAYCLNRNVYEIDEVVTPSGSYKIVDINYNVNKDPVACCPGEVIPGQTCNDNFQWVPIEEAECSLFDPCEGADFRPSGSQTLVKYMCVNDRCVPEFQDVECSSDADCIGNSAGPRCDTQTWSCYDPIIAPNGTVPGEIPKCKSCEEFALSKMFGSVFESKQCKPKLLALPPQTYTFCWFAFLRLLLVPIVFIFTILFSGDILQKFNALKGKKKGVWRIIVSVIIALILAYLVYILFWVGIILFLVYIVARILMGVYL